MDSQEIKLLLIEDTEADATRIQDMLKRSKRAKFVVGTAATLTKSLERLAKNEIHAVLLDLGLPDSMGLETFGRVHAHAPKLPIVIVTGAIDEMQAINAFQKGAQDYLIKWQFDSDLLERSILYAIERNRIKSQLYNMQEKIQRVNSCFLGFSEDPSENISRLTAIFGEVLGAACALYNRIDEENVLCSVGQWRTPADFNLKGKSEGRICYDVIKKGGGKMFLIRDLQNTDYAKTDPNVKNYKLQTYFGYPVIWNNQVVGSLCAVYNTDYIPSEDDLNLVDIIAAAIEVEEKRARAEDELKESEERFRIIFESTTDCVMVWDKHYNYLYANQAAIEHVGVSRDRVIGKNIESGLGHIPEFMNLWKKRIDKVFQTQKPMKVEDAVKVGERFICSESVISPLRDRNGDVFAVGVVYRDITNRKQTDIEMERINKKLIRFNKRIRLLTLKDPQTGLYNHKYLAEIMDLEFYRAKHYRLSLAVTMLDIDFFKSVNDIYGHKFGDLVLKQLARELKNMIRQYDVLARYGGEEFVVLSTGANRMQALTLAQRIMDGISQCRFGDKKNKIKLKMSIAVVSYPEDKTANAMDLIKTAEYILSRIKEEGGDKVYSSLDRDKAAKRSRKIKIAKTNILMKKIEKMNKQVNRNLVESIFAFARTIESRDHYTGEHVERTVKYATEIASALGLSKYEIEMVKEAAILHDLGKIGISDKILTKEARLTAKEREAIKKHPAIAADILRPIHVLNAVIPFILYHHERWDGKGYPDGLKGEGIPLGARIVAIADVYQALISNRPYRKAFPKKEALKIIEASSGKQFDPKIVGIFLAILKKENHR